MWLMLMSLGEVPSALSDLLVQCSKDCGPVSSGVGCLWALLEGVDTWWWLLRGSPIFLQCYGRGWGWSRRRTQRPVRTDPWLYVHSQVYRVGFPRDEQASRSCFEVQLDVIFDELWFYPMTCFVWFGFIQWVTARIWAYNQRVALSSSLMRHSGSHFSVFDEGCREGRNNAWAALCHSNHASVIAWKYFEKAKSKQ